MQTENEEQPHHNWHFILTSTRGFLLLSREENEEKNHCTKSFFKNTPAQWMFSTSKMTPQIIKTGVLPLSSFA